MRPSKHPQLGKIVGEFQQLLHAEAQDWDQTYQLGAPSECYPMIGRSHDKAREKFVKANGFANLQHFFAVVESRTSFRWVHFNIAC